jgi:hypothetical protein
MECPVWTIQHQSRLRGTVSSAHAAQGAQGQRGAAVPCATGADGGRPLCAQAGLGLGRSIKFDLGVSALFQPVLDSRDTAV